MKVLELMHVLGEAYDRFGDIDVIPTVHHVHDNKSPILKEVIIESEEVILLIEENY
jgi:hypothetical protein